MLRARSLVPCVTVSAVLGAGACNLTPSATTTDTDAGTATDSETGGASDTTGGPDTATTDPPTTSLPTTTVSTATTGPGTDTDDPTATTDATTDGTTTGVNLDDVTIYDLQGGTIPENSVVTVKGVVITSPVNVKDGILFVQEPDGGERSGIAVYMYEELVMNFPVKPGVVVDIKGEYTEFYGESQLKVTAVDDIMQVGEGEPLLPEVVTPADIATGGAKAEAYEGVLVEVQDVTVTNPSIDIGDFEVTGTLRINDFFLFPLGMDPQVFMGQAFQRIAGPLRYSFDNHKIAPRTPGDLVSEAVPGAEYTIFEIQEGMVPENTPVVVKGAIVSSPLTFKKEGFFIQDPMGGEYSGIYVFIDTNVVAVKPGDVVDIEGTYVEFYEFSQIQVSDPAKVTVTGMGALPAPVLVAATDVTAGGPLQEQYEGVLVTVENVQVAAVDMMYGEYELTDGLFVDDLFFAKVDWTLPMVGDMFASLTGPLAWNFDEAKLSPRDAADITP